MLRRTDGAILLSISVLPASSTFCASAGAPIMAALPARNARLLIFPGMYDDIFATPPFLFPDSNVCLSGRNRNSNGRENAPWGHLPV
jgi:hypothetical protein